MKKISALLLTAALVLSMGTTAFAAAAPADPTTNVTINGVTDRDYTAYKLLTASVKDDTKFAYQVNEKYADLLIDGLGLESTATEADIISKLGELTASDTMRHFADDLYRAIQAAGLTPDANWAGETTTLEQAYWLIADVTDLSGTNESNSLVMIDTVGDTDVTINAKPAGITTVKQVDDENDSLIAPSPISEDAVLLQDTADYDIGDAVPFNIHTRLPNNVAEYDYYSLVMQDSVSIGLTYIEDSFKIMVNGTPKTIGVKGTANVDFYYEIVTNEDANGVQTSQELYVYPAFGYTAHDGEALAASKDNGGDFLKLFAEDTAHSTINSSEVVFTYDCILNENAIIGIDGNPNYYTLRYSNNPYDDTFGETPEDTNIVLTYKVTFNKVDTNGTKLTGADFDLFKFIAKAAADAMTEEEGAAAGYILHPGANAWGVYEKVDSKNVEDADATVFSFVGLDDGFYKIEETKVPEGYNGIEPIEFRIVADHVTTLNGNPVITSLEGRTKVSGELTFSIDTGAGSLTTNIENHSGAELPTTGGFGTTMMYIGGTLLVAFAVVVLVTGKRMKIEA